MAQRRRWIVLLLRVGMVSMGVVFGMSTWVASSASIEMVMLFAVFPTTAGAIAAMLTAGRRDMFVSVLAPIAGMSAFTLATSPDIQLRGLALLWVFYSATLTVIHSTLNKTVRTAILLQKTSEDLLAEIELDQVKLTETNAQLATSIEQLTHQATHDALTGLLNRRGMFETLESLIERATNRATRRRAVLGPRPLQGSQRHARASRRRSLPADRRRSHRRAASSPPGVAGRIGGDEFIVALPGARRADDGRRRPPVARRARPGDPRRGSRVAVVGQHRHRPRTDARHQRQRGAWPTPTSRCTGPSPTGAAGSTHFDTELASENRKRIDLELRLRRAIDDGDIVPFFQPELDASTGMIVGAELLARWVQPNGTVVPAHEFMDLAVSAGLLDRVTERVLGGARRQIRRLAVLGLPDGFRFRVNLAPHSTERPWRDNPHRRARAAASTRTC